MRRYVLRRLLLFVPTLFGASLLVFVLLRLVPGDIAEILVYQTGSESSTVQKKQIQQIRAELGLDRPVLVQYAHWMWDALRGDFGQSYSQRRPVSAILAERFPRSMELAALTLFLAVIWAVPLGVVSAVRQNSWVDYLARDPQPVSGLRLPHLRHGRPHPLPAGALLPLDAAAGVLVPFTEDPLENLKQLIWPALCQAYYISAPITRLTRSQMLEVDPPRLCPDRARQGSRRARGGLPPRAHERPPPRGHLRGLVGRPPAGRPRDHGDHLRRARHGHLAGAGGLATATIPTVQAFIFVMAVVFLLRQPGRSIFSTRGSTRASGTRDGARARPLPRSPAARRRGGGDRARHDPGRGAVAPALAPHGPKETGFAPVRGRPAREFPMGTDQVGRDVLSRVIWGARLSLQVGLSLGGLRHHARARCGAPPPPTSAAPRTRGASESWTP